MASLPYPVAVSLDVGSGGRIRCTGLVIGMADEGDATAEVTSASLREIRVSELLEVITGASDLLSKPRTVTAAELAGLAGPGYDPADFRSTDGGKTYELPPLISYRGPEMGRPFLDRLLPGMVPEAPPQSSRIRGQALGRDHFEWVAGEYRRALKEKPSAPMREMIRRLTVKLKREIPEPTARRWVQRARDLGMLGPSAPGKAGEYPDHP
jgi:hypothetical protein